MKHDFLNVPKIMDYKILYILLPQVKTFTLYAYLNINSKELNFLTLFYKQCRNFFEQFLSNK